ncbi:Protein Mis18-Beta [Manis pentadactyla]|nr:Protein Mis18-Beta [Manis pentadactyla]
MASMSRERQGMRQEQGLEGKVGLGGSRSVSWFPRATSWFEVNRASIYRCGNMHGERTGRKYMKWFLFLLWRPQRPVLAGGRLHIHRTPGVSAFLSRPDSGAASRGWPSPEPHTHTHTAHSPARCTLT